MCAVCLGGLDTTLELPELGDVHRFAAAAQTGSFAAAAHQLGVAQQTVSRSVARLEEYSGARFFDRAAHRAAVTELTSEGRLALPTASQMVYLGASLRRGGW